MKKNNTYITDNEIDLGDLIKKTWREKILILSISIICGLVGYLYASFQAQELKAEITLKNLPPQLFEPYSHLLYNNNNNNIVEQFNSEFKLNFLSLDNVQSFIEEDKSGKFDNFKAYLKLKNISIKEYFVNKLYEVKEKNLIIPNKYFFVFTKELDGDIFLNNYAEFIKNKTVLEIKNILKLSILNKLTTFENALEKATLINLENPILRSLNHLNQVINEPQDLFYKGSKILSQEIIYLNRLLTKLENDQFNFEIILDKSLNSPIKKMLNHQYFAIGLMLGLFLSLGIIFFKNILRDN